MENKNKQRKRNSNNFIRTINLLIVLSFVVVVIFAGRTAVTHNVGGEDLKDRVKVRQTQTKDLPAKRGNIYDGNENPLAQTLPTYNMYAVLDPSYSDNLDEDDKQRHVTKPEEIAKNVAPIIGMEESLMVSILKGDAYQVEFAPAGNSLTQSQKDAIDELDLEGIYFNENASRNYPQNRFASHIIGYASYDQETKHLEGKMGIEALLDEDYLRGKDGKHTYEVNSMDMKIESATEIMKEPVDGYDVYLTLDTNIQQMLDSKMIEIESGYEVDWASVIVADPKTGAILGAAQTPSFDPNVLDIESYVNVVAQAEFEVGSIMKPITFASAIDVGRYDGNKPVATGSINIDGAQIGDWNGSGWGTIEKDRGLCKSANTITADVVLNDLTAEEQREYLKRFGFGQRTGIEIADEVSGSFVLSSDLERVTSGFGQGSTATNAQIIQAYNAIANDGKMMQLHLVDKIVDPTTGNFIYKSTPEVVGEPISKATADKVTELLVETANDQNCASSDMYKMETAKFAGKTGTAEVVNPENGQYYSGLYTYTYAGFAPADDPNFVILSTVYLPIPNNNTATVSIITGLHDEINRYLSSTGSDTNVLVNDKTTATIKIDSFPSFINVTRDELLAYVEKNNMQRVTIIGTGDRIINQNIEPYTEYLSTQRLIIRTNSEERTYVDFTGWSKKDVEAFAKLAEVEVIFEGNGYVSTQSIEAGTEITSENRTITLQLMV